MSIAHAVDLYVRIDVTNNINWTHINWGTHTGIYDYPPMSLMVKIIASGIFTQFGDQQIQHKLI